MHARPRRRSPPGASIWLVRSLTSEEQAHQATLSEVEQLQTQNAMLEIIARSVDVPLAFQALASRIARLVPCDRVGLALLDRGRRGVPDLHGARAGRRAPPRPRPEVVFKVERTVIGSVVRSREPLIVDDIEDGGARLSRCERAASPPGFGSALIVPLVSNGRAVGTLNVVSRAAATRSTSRHVDAAAADRRDLRGRLGRAAAPACRRQAPDDGSDVRADAGGRGRDQQRPADDHRPLRLCWRGYPRPSLQRDVSTIVAPGAADQRRCSRRCGTQRPREPGPRSKHGEPGAGSRRVRR